MCIVCYSQYGQPVKITSTVLDTLTQLHSIADLSAHSLVVLDDWNIEDTHIKYALEAKDSLTVDEYNLLCKLLTITLAERATVLALYEGLI